MSKDYMQTSIDSYKVRLDGRKEDAIAAIRDGAWWTAQAALGECVGFEEVIHELEHQIEVAGVMGDD